MRGMSAQGCHHFSASTWCRVARLYCAHEFQLVHLMPVQRCCARAILSTILPDIAEAFRILEIGMQGLSAMIRSVAISRSIARNPPVRKVDFTCTPSTTKLEENSKLPNLSISRWAVALTSWFVSVLVSRIGDVRIPICGEWRVACARSRWWIPVKARC